MNKWITIRFKNLMYWQEDPDWYDWVDGHWVLTDKAPKEARHSFELYTEELRRYPKDLEPVFTNA